MLGDSGKANRGQKSTRVTDTPISPIASERAVGWLGANAYIFLPSPMIHPLNTRIVSMTQNTSNTSRARPSESVYCNHKLGGVFFFWPSPMPSVFPGWYEATQVCLPYTCAIFVCFVKSNALFVQLLQQKAMWRLVFTLTEIRMTTMFAWNNTQPTTHKGDN